MATIPRSSNVLLLVLVAGAALVGSLELTPSGAVAQEVRMPSRTTASIAVVR